MIARAKREWLSQLLVLWQEAFQDEAGVIQSFYEQLFQEENTWCYVEEQEPVAVIYGLDAFLWETKEGVLQKTPMKYFYAGATKKAQQGKGYYGELMKAIGEADRVGGIPFLVPVEHLVSYYQRQGFAIVACQEQRELTEQYLKECKERTGQSEQTGKTEQTGQTEQSEQTRAYELYVEQDSITPKEYKRIREERLGKPGFIEWPEQYLGYTIKSNENYGGISRRCTVNGVEHALLGIKKDTTLRIVESTLSIQELEACGFDLCQEFGCSDLVLKGNKMMSTKTQWSSTPYLQIILDE